MQAFDLGAQNGGLTPESHRANTQLISFPRNLFLQI